MTGHGYHHGNLRRAVLDAALDVIATQGPAALSLRDLARRAGVSHAAPAHHFGDKAGLLTAIAAEGYALLTEALAGPPNDPAIDFVELGVRYVRFALDHPAHFDVMFRPDLYDPADDVVRQARDRAGRALADHAARVDRGESARIAAWSAAHGFAVLWRSGALEGSALAHARDPDAAFRDVARAMFAR